MTSVVVERNEEAEEHSRFMNGSSQRDLLPKPSRHQKKENENDDWMLLHGAGGPRKDHYPPRAEEPRQWKQERGYCDYPTYKQRYPERKNHRRHKQRSLSLSHQLTNNSNHQWTNESRASISCGSTAKDTSCASTTKDPSTCASTTNKDLSESHTSYSLLDCSTRSLRVRELIDSSSRGFDKGEYLPVSEEEEQPQPPQVEEPAAAVAPSTSAASRNEYHTIGHQSDRHICYRHYDDNGRHLDDSRGYAYAERSAYDYRDSGRGDYTHHHHHHHHHHYTYQHPPMDHHHYQRPRLYHDDYHHHDYGYHHYSHPPPPPPPPPRYYPWRDNYYYPPEPQRDWSRRGGYYYEDEYDYPHHFHNSFPAAAPPRATRYTQSERILQDSERTTDVQPWRRGPHLLTRVRDAQAQTDASTVTSSPTITTTLTAKSAPPADNSQRCIDQPPPRPGAYAIAYEPSSKTLSSKNKKKKSTLQQVREEPHEEGSSSSRRLDSLAIVPVSPKKEPLVLPTIPAPSSSDETVGSKRQLKVPPGPDDDIFIEIGAGIRARLRRTRETMDAIQQDYYVPAQCYCCSTDLFCIADVKYLICPSCHSISPLEEGENKRRQKETKGLFVEGEVIRRRGVGLGFTYDTLFQMQAELVAKSSALHL